MKANNLSSWLWRIWRYPKDYTFLTLVIEEAIDLILEHGLLYNNEKLKVSITQNMDLDNLSELCISTILIVNNLLQKESQFAIVKTMIKKLFGEDNIIIVSFVYTPKPKEDRQAGWCHIQCLN